MITDDLRKSFLKYFEGKEHTVVSGSSLVPHNDPTILFTNAGMNQFKHVFTGEEKKSFKKATSCQKCMRAGGKHNDLENVGYTARHHTFFEMLGNFSFGDYFKREAIEYAWEYVTSYLDFKEDKLWVSVYEDDDEAFKIWNKNIGISKNRIMRFGKKDNFWAMGDTGPCGPCSEIFYDIGEFLGRTDKDSDPSKDEDRFIEFWNLVFMEFDRDSDGNLKKLPHPSIDTGMGLERVSAIKHKVTSNYEIDIFKSIFDLLGEISGKNYSKANDENKISMKAIADHARACTFLISEGIVPSNEGRGYVLRRIVRRALRHGHLLGIEGEFLHKLVDSVVASMGTFYGELVKEAESVKTIIRNEEKSFLETLTKGMYVVNSEIEALFKKSKTKKVELFSGDKAFDLYQTYGFPLDLTQDALKRHGIKVDITGFEKAFEKHREKAKGSFENNTEKTYDDNLKKPDNPTQFVGYDSLIVEDAKYLYGYDGGWIDDNFKRNIGTITPVIFDKTPFYGESGGQVGDTGYVELLETGEKIEIINTRILPGGIYVHDAKYIKLKKDYLSEYAKLKLIVDKNKRDATQRNHSATHLLHKALQKNLGKHVKQAGSYVDDQRLRFDFSHTKAIDSDMLRKIEDDVNKEILKNTELKKEVMPIKKAKDMGAMALFGEKYGETVRVISVPGYSIELCGGTHVNRTGDIGIVKIISEGSVASGLRRIEAVTGDKAVLEFRKSEDLLQEAAGIMKIGPEEIISRITKNIARVKELEKKLKSGSGEDIKTKSGELVKNAKSLGDSKIISAVTEVEDPKELREMTDITLDKLGKGIVVLGTKSKGKAFIAAKISKDLLDKYSAKSIIQDISKIIGGGGGGKPEMAEAGGSKPEKLKEALDKVFEIIAG